MSQEGTIQISFKKVSKSYGSVVALDDVSFEIKKGEFVFITGASGAGKTTILKLILGEIIPTKGEVKVDNLDITSLDEKNLPSYRQKIGMIFQDFKVLTERTVFENIAVALSVIGLPETEWEDRVKHVLKLVGLTRQINLFPSQLSGGELQRVSLARALSVNPKIILADEPTGNLDWENSVSLMELLEKINGEGKTVIMATHNMELVKKYKKRVIHVEATKVHIDEEKDSKTEKGQSESGGKNSEDDNKHSESENKHNEDDNKDVEGDNKHPEGDKIKEK
jgi:cell division transport system ATP-binding protein